MEATSVTMANEGARGNTSPRQWIRTLFSFPAMCLALLIAVIAQRCYVEGLREGDIWWHLANVRYLLQNHTLPRIDTFSSGAAGSPWINHEWLSEIPFYAAYKSLGYQGLLALYFVLIILIFAGVYYRAMRAGADCKAAMLATCLGIMLGEVSFDPRTLLFGWACMVGLLLILDWFQRSGIGIMDVAAIVRFVD